MAQPTPYDPAYSFTEWQVLNPTRPLPADKVDEELASIQSVIDEILDRLALIQRDDGEVANATIGYEQFAPELDLGFSPPAAWVTATLYDTRDTVFFGTGFYRCTVEHTSGSFLSDLSAGKWLFIADLGGTDGEDGADGADGTASGLKWNFDSSTTTNADPGTGDVRLNNAALASVTQIAIDDACAESGNPDASAWVATWDDSTSTIKGLLVVKKTSAPQNFAIYHLTGITDQTGYTQLAVSYVTHSGSFTNGDSLIINFISKGDKGDQGLSGAGTGDLLAANNLSDVASAATARTNLGLAIGTNVQAYNANLASLAGLTLAANKLPYATGASTLALTDLTAFARTILDDADAGTVRATLGLTIGTNVQAQSAILAALAGLSPGANKLGYFTGAAAMSLTDLSAYGRSLIDDADASAARSTLGLGTAATLNAGTSPNNVVQLDGTGKLPAVDGSQLTGISGGGGSGAWEFFDEIVIGSGDSVCDITSIPSFRAVRITFIGVVMATASTTLYMRASANNGASFLSTSIYRIANEDSTVGAASAASAQLDLTGNTVSTAISGEITLMGTIRFVSQVIGLNTGNNYFCASKHGHINSTGINAYRLYPSSGNFTSGRVFVEYIPT